MDRTVWYDTGCYAHYTTGGFCPRMRRGRWRKKKTHLVQLVISRWRVSAAHHSSLRPLMPLHALSSTTNQCFTLTITSRKHTDPMQTKLKLINGICFNTTAYKRGAPPSSAGDGRLKLELHSTSCSTGLERKRITFLLPNHNFSTSAQRYAPGASNTC